jgi:hypothetical protein
VVLATWSSRITHARSVLDHFVSLDRRIHTSILTDHKSMINYWLLHDMKALQCLPQQLVWSLCNNHPSRGLDLLRHIFPSFEYRRTLSIELTNVLARNDAALLAIAHYLDEPLFSWNHIPLSSKSSMIGWWSPPSPYLISLMSSPIGVSNGPWRDEKSKDNAFVPPPPITSSTSPSFPLPSSPSSSSSPVHVVPERNHRGHITGGSAMARDRFSPQAYHIGDGKPWDTRTCLTWIISYNTSIMDYIGLTLWSDGTCWLKMTTPRGSASLGNRSGQHSSWWYFGSYTLLPITSSSLPLIITNGSSSKAERVTWRLRGRVTNMISSLISNAFQSPSYASLPGSHFYDIAMDIYELPDTWGQSLSLPSSDGVVITPTTTTPMVAPTTTVASDSKTTQLPDRNNKRVNSNTQKINNTNESMISEWMSTAGATWPAYLSIVPTHVLSYKTPTMMQPLLRYPHDGLRYLWNMTGLAIGLSISLKNDASIEASSHSIANVHVTVATNGSHGIGKIDMSRPWYYDPQLVPLSNERSQPPGCTSREWWPMALTEFSEPLQRQDRKLKTT